MKTILCIIGTRPEAIKMAPVVREIRRHPDALRAVVCSTGQHGSMLNQVFELFNIQPDIDLALMRPDQSLSALTARLITGLDETIEKLKPDWVLAQGDTTSVLAAALVSFYRGVKFGHVEAGLRTGDKHRPFPEEINRRVADLIADAYFAPTEQARATLLQEGIAASRIHVTGNTVIDALIDVAAQPYDWATGPLANLPREKRWVLITAHRRESFGQPFRDLCLALRDLAHTFRDRGTHFVYPVHLNPNVRRPVQELLADVPNLTLLEPLDYASLVHLMKHSTLILTDSGGIQEEAPSLGVPVLVMRDTTERPEGVAAGAVRLVGTDRTRIVAEATHLLNDPAAHARMVVNTNPYGDGKASARIVSTLL